MVDKIMKIENDTKLMIMSIVINKQKGSHKDLIEKLLKNGFIRARVDGKEILLEEINELEKNKQHTIELIVDRIVKKEDSRTRIF